MKAPRTEELLTKIRSVLHEDEPPESVIPMLEAAGQAMQHTRNEFLRQSQDDPEISEQVREKISGALAHYIENLLELHGFASGGDLDALDAGLEKTEQAIGQVRAAQDEHRVAIATGVTLFPYLNRVLFQTSTVRDGAGSDRLLALLAEAPPFLKSLRTELGRRDVSPMRSQVVFELQQTLDNLQATLESGSPPSEVEAEIEDAAAQLAGLLSEPLLESTDPGLTPIQPINQILEILGGSEVDSEYLLVLISQCQDYLRSLLPAASPPERVEKLNEVLATLDALANWASGSGDSEDIQTVLETLVSGATELTATLADAQLDGFEQYSESVGDLPPVFKSALINGHLYLDGQGSADNVYASSEHLYSSASEVLAQTEEFPSDDPHLNSLREAVDMMREAADLLRELAENANPQYLEIASDLCHQAAERLNQAVA